MSERNRESKKIKLQRADHAVFSSYQNRLFLMGQNAAIKEQRRGNTTLPVVFITLTRVPATLLVAAMHSASRRKTTTSQRHVNQEHSIWTVANNYSNCHR